MPNRFGIPQDVECRLRQNFKVCAYCRQAMKVYAGVGGCMIDRATIEHLNRHGPFYWWTGLKEEELVLCCGRCNSSRGTKRLEDWFRSRYCVENGISVTTVAEEVRQYLQTKVASD
jgi:hypothetical protein